MITIDLLNVFEKKATLFFVQVDHVCGETLGTVIDDLYQAGAYNVQIISTITKKNRPGYLFTIDCGENNHNQIEHVILNEIGATGWHKISTGHRHVATKIEQHIVSFNTPEGEIHLPIQIKLVPSFPNRIRPEHDSCLMVRNILKEKGMNLSLEEIKYEICNQLQSMTV